nr:hypothetical protein A5880_001963 [Enterococcus sp. 4G2_DIV0659]
MLFIRYIGISFYEAFHYSENFTFEAFPTSVPKELYKKIAEFHAMFNKNNPLAHELLFEKKYFHIAYTWIYYIIDYAKNTQLKIAIHFSKDTLSELFIQNKIRQIYSEHSVTFVQQMSEADIIISDFAEPAVDNKTIVYMGNIFEENNWFSLFQCIQEKLFSKTLL